MISPFRNSTTCLYSDCPCFKVSALARVLTSKKHRSMTNLLVNDVGLRRGALPLMQAMLSQVR